MATLILEIPEEVERELDAAFPEEERATLLLEVIERAARERNAARETDSELQQRRGRVIEKLNQLRDRGRRLYSDAEISGIRQELRA